jgi:hypothetical protein
MSEKIVQYYHAINPKAVAAFDQIIQRGYLLEAIFLSASSTSGYYLEFKQEESALPSGLFERPLNISGYSQAYLFFQSLEMSERLVLATLPVEDGPERVNLPFGYSWIDFADPFVLNQRQYLDFSMELRQSNHPRVFLKGLNFAYQNFAIYGLVYEGRFDELLFNGEEDDDPEEHPVVDVNMDNFIILRSPRSGSALYMTSMSMHFLRDDEVGTPTVSPYRLAYQIRHHFVK